ncbi:hypothetical protein HanIR_Chr04g0150511 [Helianthus annuus]|nr:hypothetical protein HanIR_Chr04g0150511 [Helianthus annuus]
MKLSPEMEVGICVDAGGYLCGYLCGCRSSNVGICVDAGQWRRWVFVWMQVIGDRGGGVGHRRCRERWVCV